MKKIISLLLAIVAISLTATTAYAANKTEEQKAHFNSISGTVKEIRVSEADKNISYALIVNDKGMEVNLVLNKDTYYINDEKIRIGSKLTGYYDANAMTIMIYPPQYVAVAAMVSNSGQSIKVDLFDSNLTSADNTLKLNIGKDTEIVSKNGKAFKGELKNRKLAVFYDVATKSIPAQTTPAKVVVLSDAIKPDKEKNSYYGSFKGKVTKISEVKNDKNKSQITLESSDGLQAIFTVSKDTYRTNNEKIVVGSTATGYYDAKVFRTMIYPAQYEAEVFDVARPNYSIKVDYFDNNLTSADNTLKLKIAKNTELVYMDGSKYSGNPVKTNLIVIYSKATKSLPAQTEPVKVVVLEQKAKKDTTKATEKVDWKSKLNEWIKLTDELFDNMDKLADNKNELNTYLKKLMARKEFTELLKELISGK